MIGKIINAAVKAGKQEAQKQIGKTVRDAKRAAVNGVRDAIGLPPKGGRKR